MQVHLKFTQEHQKLNLKYEGHFTGPYGVGSMVAFTVFGGDLEMTKKFTGRLFENGVISFIAGKNPTRVRFLLPVMAVTDEDIVKATAIIEKTFLELTR